MPRALKPAELPDWPRRMRATLAAAYVDEPLSTFYQRYGAIAVERTAGARRWYREDLDSILDAEKAGVDAGHDRTDPFLEGLENADKP